VGSELETHANLEACGNLKTQIESASTDVCASITSSLKSALNEDPVASSSVPESHRHTQASNKDPQCP